MKLTANKYADGTKEFIGVKDAFSNKQEFLDAVCTEFDITADFNKPAVEQVSEGESVVFSDMEQIAQYAIFVLNEKDLVSKA